MAEVMKFDDFKNEGSEAAVKVTFIEISCTLISYAYVPLSIFFVTGCWKI